MKLRTTADGVIAHDAEHDRWVCLPGDRDLLSVLGDGTVANTEFTDELFSRCRDAINAARSGSATASHAQRSGAPISASDPSPTDSREQGRLVNASRWLPARAVKPKKF